MDEQQIKSMIQNILENMTDGSQSSNYDNEINDNQETVSTSSEVEHGKVLPDITKIDIKKQFLVPNPHDKKGYLKLKSYTPARLGMWRTGVRYKTASVLRFQADHAAAQDAVFNNVNPELPKKMGFLETQTECTSKQDYLTRPDHGRKFSSEMVEKIKENVTMHPKVQMVVGDGLSSTAIEANIPDILPAIEKGLESYGLGFKNKDVIFVKYARVGIEDQIGEITDADVVCMLVGERPGLVTAKSMSAYIAYKPTIDMPEANRTVISNIHNGGMPAVEAGAYIAEMIDKILKNKKSGIELKEIENAQGN
ncbi:ethanolamine ammonia-lyase subunit EutC [Limosilactobacillus sp. STM2_1]|uniref:Ethanolamine ammonia-lyase small subunit n=1 Tax=Limosilactobacillus rudii TaxID=2759755 RepID=A0A7W3UL01_9LACO|nr:ethanolamine ammonia-lyase subunit EutC [Limosilactobacillus rudii]MBB1079451.1 ethanolamine ammonia-lyase subunit EutC [Limosilactobacillus rudii]MBB1097497.1 ethanolamine ammonia-lyase subunit EutC [Limosilactobacillus rudii]MCD7134607.1 ethanolamine ammonia-lyase subunit EutC [Limosilactobacillus rudii]